LSPACLAPLRANCLFPSCFGWDNLSRTRFCPKISWKLGGSSFTALLGSALILSRPWFLRVAEPWAITPPEAIFPLAHENGPACGVSARIALCFLIGMGPLPALPNSDPPGSLKTENLLNEKQFQKIRNPYTNHGAGNRVLIAATALN